jgi:hypothetical protein
MLIVNLRMETEAREYKSKVLNFEFLVLSFNLFLNNEIRISSDEVVSTVNTV